MRVAPERWPGRGRGGRRPISDPGPEWAAWLFIYFRNLGIFSGTSTTWICTKEYLSSHEFFYRVQVGPLNRVVSISHFGKQILPWNTSLQEGTVCRDFVPQTCGCEGLCWWKPLQFPDLGSFLQACPSCPFSQQVRAFCSPAVAPNCRLHSPSLSQLLTCLCCLHGQPQGVPGPCLYAVLSTQACLGHISNIKNDENFG